MKNYKKLISLILVLFGTFNSFSFSFAETVYDGAVPGWTIEYSDGASGSTSFENGEASDDFAVVLSSTGTGSFRIKQAIPTKIGQSYECSVKVKTKDLNGAYIYAENQKRDIRTGTNNWSLYKFVFNAKNETSEIGIVINNTGSISVDDFTLKDENGNVLEIINSDFNKIGADTSSSSVSVDDGININKEILSSEEIPYFYSTQKKVPLFYAENINIDGNPSDWSEYPSVYMPADSTQVAKLKSWDGVNDLSANVYLAYDEDSFYLCAIVEDDEHWIKPEQYWAGDCIQLGFTNNGSYGPEIGIYFDENGNYIDSPIGKESEMVFMGKRNGTQSIYEYKIPWKMLYDKTPEDNIVFNVLVDDADKSERQAFIEWTDGIGYAKSPDSITLQFISKEESGFASWIDAPAQLTVGQTQVIYVNLFNRGNEAQNRTVKIPSLDFEQEIAIDPGAVRRIPVEYKAEHAGTQTLNVTIEGEEIKTMQHSVKVVEKDKYQNLDLSNLEGGKISKLEALIEECRSKGIAVDYEELDLNVIKRFVNYYYDDIESGYPERATYIANNLERLADEAIENLNAYLAGTKKANSVQKYLGGDLEIDGFNIISETEDSVTGEITRRPVFLAGYGHTTDARNDLLDLPNFGANIFQHELGVYHTVVGYSQTPDAENIMDRFIFSDDIYNERIVPVIERATATNQAVDLILSPHYFPKFVQEKHPETTAPNQTGMNKNINFYAEKSKEVIEAHVRYFLNKIKDVPIIKSICLTNEPALDVRNCYEPGNMNNNVTAAWVEYLKETYETISRLNKYYNADYASFEEVPMISVVSNDVPTYDWLIFNNNMFAEWHEWLAGIVHEIMPDIPVHTKIMNMVYDNGSFLRATDPELFVKFSGFNGNDAYFCYPESNPLGKYAWYDFEGSLKEMPIFDSENHIITDGDSDFVPEHAYQNGTDIWQGALHGRSLTCIWVWGRDNNPDSALNGSLLFRPDVVSEIGKNILDLSRLSYEAAAINDEPYRIRVYYSWTSRVYDNATNGTTNTAYKGATYTGEKTGYITETQLAERNFNDCDIIIVPYVPNTHEESVAGLKEFMEQGGKVFIMNRDSLTHNERKEKIHSQELEYIQENATYWDKNGKSTVNENDVSNYLFDYYDTVDGIGEVRVIDINTGEPVKNVEWRSTEYDGHTIINLCNYTWDGNREVYITVNGKLVTGAYDLKNTEECNGLITLNSYEPRLIRVDELSDSLFEDVKGHWAQKYIERMTLKGVLSGVSENTFLPDKAISAQELLMALVKFNGYDCGYSEVFETAKELWDMDEKFFAKTELTREEVAQIICIACKISNDNADISFMSDAGEISSEAYDSVAALYAEGAMTGRSESTINPKDMFTRAEAVTVLSRL